MEQNKLAVATMLNVVAYSKPPPPPGLQVLEANVRAEDCAETWASQYNQALRAILKRTAQSSHKVGKPLLGLVASVLERYEATLLSAALKNEQAGRGPKNKKAVHAILWDHISRPPIFPVLHESRRTSDEDDSMARDAISQQGQTLFLSGVDATAVETEFVQAPTPIMTNEYVSVAGLFYCTSRRGSQSIELPAASSVQGVKSPSTTAPTAAFMLVMRRRVLDVCCDRKMKRKFGC
jgi:hypothetical protein